MGIIKSIRSWRQDRQRVSMQKHEVDYIKKLTKKYLKETEGMSDHGYFRIRVSSLRKLSKYILKTHPKVNRNDR